MARTKDALKDWSDVSIQKPTDVTPPGVQATPGVQAPPVRQAGQAEIAEAQEDISQLGEELSQQAKQLRTRRRFEYDAEGNITAIIMEYTNLVPVSGNEADDNIVWAIPTDTEGNEIWHADPNAIDYSNSIAALNTIRESMEDVETFAEWLESTEQEHLLQDPTKGIASITKLAGQLADTDATAKGVAEQTAISLGFTDAAEMNAALSGMLTEVMAGSDAQAGLSAQELQLRQNLQDRSIYKLNEVTARDLDAILGETGSSIRALQQLDHYRQQMVDSDARYQNEIVNADFARRETNYNELKDRLGMLWEERRLTTDSYRDGIREDRVAAITGYANGVLGMIEQNDQLLNQYSKDLTSIQMQANIANTLINAELGLDEYTASAVAEAYNEHLKPGMEAWQISLAALDADVAAQVALHPPAVDYGMNAGELGAVSVLSTVGAIFALIPGGQVFGVALVGLAGFITAVTQLAP